MDDKAKEKLTLVRKSVEPKVPEEDGMLPVKLLKHYRPAGEYKVIQEVDTHYPGVGFPNKLWAGTIVRLPKEEAKDLVMTKKIAERADAFD